MTKDTIEIIVVTFNRIKYLKTFIKFLYRSTKYPFNLIVVDNGSIDGSREFILEKEREGLVWKHVFNENNLPLSMAFNEGLKVGNSEFVITVADDMVVNPLLNVDWLEVFVAKMNQDHKIGCINFVGSRCLHDKFLRIYDK